MNKGAKINLEIPRGELNSYYEPEADLANYFFFASERNNYCKAHFHNSIEVLYVKEGTHSVWINGVKNILEAGDIAFSNAFDAHYYRYEQSSEVYVMLVGQDLLNNFKFKFPSKEFPNILRKVGNSESEMNTVFDLIKHYKEDNFQIIYGLVNVFWGILLKYYKLQDSNKRSKDSFIEILAYIDKHYRENLSIEILADKFGYSKVYFSRLFNNYVGMHFRDYINKVRLYRFNLMKKEENNSSVVELALQCGFDSLSTYYRTIKKAKPTAEGE